MSNKWNKNTNDPINLEGTEMGDLVQNLMKLQEHFSEELNKNLQNLEYLEKKKETLLVQARKRKVKKKNGNQ